LWRDTVKKLHETPAFVVMMIARATDLIGNDMDVVKPSSNRPSPIIERISNKLSRTVLMDDTGPERDQAAADGTSSSRGGWFTRFHHYHMVVAEKPPERPFIDTSTPGHIPPLPDRSFQGSRQSGC
jgi:hypothetical protein